MMTPAGAISKPFFLGGSEIQISYPTNTMNEEDKLMSMRGNNPYFSRGTVQHELLPGHNLRYLYEQPAIKLTATLTLYAFLDRRMVIILGVAALRPGFCPNARRTCRHVVLADAPLRTHYLLPKLSPRQLDTTRNALTFWLTGLATNGQMPKVKCAVRLKAITAHFTRWPTSRADYS